MNFTYDGADLSKIIKGYKKNGNEYSIKYLDGSLVKYISYREDEEERIKKEMLAQAKQRAELCNPNCFNFSDGVYLVGGLISATGLGLSYVRGQNEFEFFWIAALIISFNKFLKNNKKIKELEKYKLFLELIEALGEEKLNTTEYTKCYECDNLYAKKLSIGTLDSFEYDEIKRVYEKYKLKTK